VTRVLSSALQGEELAEALESGLETQTSGGDSKAKMGTRETEDRKINIESNLILSQKPQGMILAEAVLPHNTQKGSLYAPNVSVVGISHV
jgi:hypothetical protein